MVQRRRQWANNTAVQSQMAVSAYFTNKQILSFAFAEQNEPILHDYRAIGCNYVWSNCRTFHVDDGFLLRSHVRELRKKQP